jgi:cysteinyl-tRNA synthetase
MAQTVADYMKNFKGAVSNPIKTVNNANASAAAAQVLEMVALAKTIGKDAVKVMNEQSGQMEKQLKFDQELIKQVKAQEKVAQSLIAGQKLNTKQQDELDDTMKKFYHTVEGYNINSTKYIKNLQKYVESEVPDIIKKRISNDIKYTTKTVESTGSKNIALNANGKSADGGPIKMVRDIKRLLERSYTETKQFRGWVSDTWSSAWYTMSNGFGDLMDKLKSGDLWKDLFSFGTSISRIGFTVKCFSFIHQVKNTLSVLW